MKQKDLAELLDTDIDNVEFKVLNTKSAPFGGWFWSPNSSAMYRRSVLDFLLNTIIQTNGRFVLINSFLILLTQSEGRQLFMLPCCIQAP